MILKGDITLDQKLLNEEKESYPPLQQKKYWTWIVVFGLFHIFGLFGIYLGVTSAKLQTSIFAIVLHVVTQFSVTGGVHRLWSHRAYKATWQLKLIWMIFQTMSLQDSIYVWVRNHRLHHKYTDTDSDPHNTNNGFFYSHYGWTMVEPPPEQIEKRKLIDMSDIKRDVFVKFQLRYYLQLVIVIFFLFPIIVPLYCWNETFMNTWCLAVCLRYIMTLQGAASINSWAHFFGSQPYDKNISARETLLMSILSQGEGWHNYHHTFPWDYKASEYNGVFINPTTILLQLFGKIGWAYDFKTVSDDMLQKRIERTGDGTHETAIWGWGDREQTEENKNFVRIENKKFSNKIF